MAREGKLCSGGEINADVGEAKSLVSKQLDADRERKPVEKATVAALRLGDVSKALRILNAAPLAPKNESTFKELELHARGRG